MPPESQALGDVHPLPPAPRFVGREAELVALRHLWTGGVTGVVALVGLGGAGKTALAARFLEELLGPGGRAPRRVFVWSFYQEPDAGRFLHEAARFFAPAAAATTAARGPGLLHLLGDALSAGGPDLLVLDGLERVQAEDGVRGGRFGQVEDPLLRTLLARVADGLGRATALVTSRFPLTDLEDRVGRGYHPVALDGLDPAAAAELLRRRGVRGDDEALAGLVAAFGAHALTLDHLGGLIGEFLDGDPRRAPEAPALADVGGDRQALRLRRLLAAYEEHLPAPELALLRRLCLSTRPAPPEIVLAPFLCSPPVRARSAHDLGRQVAASPAVASWPGEERRGLGDSAAAAIEEAVAAGPLAGPDGEFRREALALMAAALEPAEVPDDDALDALGRLYGGDPLDAPTGRRPLSAADRIRLVDHARKFRALRRHPLFPHREPPAALKGAFDKLGYADPDECRVDDLGPDDVLRAYRRHRDALMRLAAAHEALRRLREQARLARRKWDLAGPLARLEEAGLGRALEALERRHLVVRGADGAINVHPAVRDHFGRPDDEAGAEGWHDLIRVRLVSLVRRPGRGPAMDPAELDAVEDAIHHALRSGRPAEARSLFERELGGVRHLGWRLGEAPRGLRILRGFEPCPDGAALAWFERALGDLDAARDHNVLPYFRADVRLLQGRLPEVAAEGDWVRAATAAFLMGDSHDLPPDVLGVAIPRAQLLLLLGRGHEARLAAGSGSLYGEIGWEWDRARAELLRAEAERRLADADACRRHRDAAAWVLRAGTVEHLTLWHLVRSRAARDDADVRGALREAEEGIELARRCGLGLAHVELLCALADAHLAGGAAEAAEEAATTALDLARSPSCRFAWGEAAAGDLLGRSLAIQWRARAARDALMELLALQQRLGDPRAARTAEQLRRLRG
ncbi:MAG TPA: hypothetical protein VG406_01455 [Isosphaeraceae bacterium]|jgi:hypothetical protein|nr:hypothetical protein [Isosphaeraceae bacterium]